MLFRIAQASDMPILLHMEQELIKAERPFDDDIKTSPCRYYDFDYLLSDAQSRVLVIEDDGIVIGMGYVQINTSKPAHQHDRHGYMGGMYIAPDQRGQGLITQLMEQLVDWSKEQGVDAFYLDVYSQNLPAIKAYQKLGFQPCLLAMKLHC